MKTILEELYDGNIYPSELIVSKDPEYCLINKKISETQENWKKELSETDYKRLEVLLNLCCQSSSLEASASFIYGFKLGAVIMLEVLTGPGELVRGGD